MTGWASRAQLLTEIFCDSFAAGVDVELAVNAFDVHQDYIRNLPGHLGERLLATRIGAKAKKSVGMADLCRQILPNPIVILDDRYFNSHNYLNAMHCGKEGEETQSARICVSG